MRCGCCYPGAESRMSKTIAVDGDAALRLLWHALAWGSGVRQPEGSTGVPVSPRRSVVPAGPIVPVISMTTKAGKPHCCRGL
jgi:hypothetical protein